MIIEELKWDSKFFGLKIGKIRLDKPLENLSEFRSLCEKNNYNLIYIFSLSRQPLLDKDGILLADEKATYQKDHSTFSTIRSDLIQINNSILNTQLIQLSIQSGAYSRFKSPTFLTRCSVRNTYAAGATLLHTASITFGLSASGTLWYLLVCSISALFLARTKKVLWLNFPRL